MKNGTYYRLMDKRHAKAVQRCKETGKFVKKRKMCTKTFLIIENILVWSFLVTGMDSTTTWTINNPIVETAQADSVDISEEPEGKSAQSDKNMDSNDIEALVRRTFGENSRVMTAILRHESGLNPNSESNVDVMNDGRAFSFGLAQINLTVSNIEGIPCNEAFVGINKKARVINEKLYKQCVDLAKDPNISILTAKKKFDSRGFQPWGSYTSGKYRMYLDK